MYKQAIIPPNNVIVFIYIILCRTFQKTENGILYTRERSSMNHLKPVSDDAMSLLRTIIKLNVADVKEIIYILFRINGTRGKC